MEFVQPGRARRGESEPLTIRRARAEDYETVCLLVELDLELHRRARPDCFKAAAERYSRQEYEALLALPHPVAWLAELGGRVVGLCFGTITATSENQFCQSRRVAFVEDLVTLPECRHRGVATALMRRARDQAVAEGAEVLELCVWHFNQNALRLYKRLGMRVQYCRMEEKLEEDHCEQ